MIIDSKEKKWYYVAYLLAQTPHFCLMFLEQSRGEVSRYFDPTPKGNKRATKIG